MQTYNNPLISTETICALATQPGGAIGVIRISGSKAIEIYLKCHCQHLALW